MPSYSRHRTLDNSRTVFGSYWHPIIKKSITVSQSLTDFKTMDDVVGNYGHDNGLFYEWRKTSNVTVDGQYNGYIYSGVPTTASAMVVPAHTLTSTISGTEVAPLSNSTLAKSNPNYARQLMPAFWAELKELPSLIRSFGRDHLKKVRDYVTGDRFNRFGERIPSYVDPKKGYPQGVSLGDFGGLSREVAERWLQWKWGIRPMISDLWKLFHTVKAAQTRLREIDSLLQSGKSSHRVTLGSDTSSTTLSSTIIWSVGCTVQSGQRQQTTTRKTWGVGRYSMTGPDATRAARWLSQQDGRRGQLARVAQILQGYRPEQLTLSMWELLPWSWFIDWFFNIQELLQRTSNVLPVTSDSVVLCRTTRTLLIGSPYANAPVRLGGLLRLERLTKVRSIGVVGVPLTVSVTPFFTGDNWVTLGSLAIAKRWVN